MSLRGLLTKERIGGEATCVNITGWRRIDVGPTSSFEVGFSIQIQVLKF